MKRSETNTIKRISILCALVLLCVVLAACSSAPEAKGNYEIYSVTLLQHSKNVKNFEMHQNSRHEIRLEKGIATVSYIYFTDVAGRKEYLTQSGQGSPMTWRTKGKNIILEGHRGVGAVDLVLEEGWILLTYYIESEPIYYARYKKIS